MTALWFIVSPLDTRVWKEWDEWKGEDSACRLWREESGSKAEFDEPSEPERRQPLRKQSWLPQSQKQRDHGGKTRIKIIKIQKTIKVWSYLVETFWVSPCWAAEVHIKAPPEWVEGQPESHLGHSLSLRRLADKTLPPSTPQLQSSSLKMVPPSSQPLSAGSLSH